MNTRVIHVKRQREKKSTASNSTELQHPRTREWDFAPLWGELRAAVPLVWHCGTPRYTRCRWSCSRCRSRTQSCSRTRWSCRSRRWNGSSQWRVPLALAGCCGNRSSLSLLLLFSRCCPVNPIHTEYPQCHLPLLQCRPTRAPGAVPPWSPQRSWLGL